MRLCTCISSCERVVSFGVHPQLLSMLASIQHEWSLLASTRHFSQCCLHLPRVVSFGFHPPPLPMPATILHEWSLWASTRHLSRCLQASYTSGLFWRSPATDGRHPDPIM